MRRGRGQPDQIDMMLSMYANLMRALVQLHGLCPGIRAFTKNTELRPDNVGDIGELCGIRRNTAVTQAYQANREARAS